jgi:hypothetical protein
MRTASHPVDPERRARLLAVKLRALVKRGWPEAGTVQPAPAAGGMAARHDGSAWVLVDEPDVARGFARALLWALHREAAELHVLVDQSPELPALARQGACFRTPVRVWGVTGADVEPVAPTALPPEPPVDPRAEQFRRLIEAAGAEVVVEWGVLGAEVLGVQVARVVVDADSARLEVGIGRHERATNLLAWGERPPVDVLALVVDAVREARRTGDLTHPLNQFGRERWLRHSLSRRPAVVGADRLDPVAPPRPVEDPRVPLLAPSVGSGDGAPLLVACSVGFDPTLVPMAAELHRARHPLGTPLVLALPGPDLHPLTRLAVEHLEVPATIRTVPDDWCTPAGGW